MYYYNQDCFTGGITGNMTKDRDFCLGIKFGFRGKCIIYDIWKCILLSFIATVAPVLGTKYFPSLQITMY